MDVSTIAAWLRAPSPEEIAAIERMIQTGAATAYASRTELRTLLVLLRANAACAVAARPGHGISTQSG